MAKADISIKSSEFLQPKAPVTPKISTHVPLKTAQTPEITPREPISPTPEIQPKAVISSDGHLSSQIDNILSKIDTLSGNHIALLLERLQDDILERKGFSGVLRQIRMSSTDLKDNMNLLNNDDKEGLRNKIHFWRSKLKL
jgi:hypothetical protein